MVISAPGRRLVTVSAISDAISLVPPECDAALQTIFGFDRSPLLERGAACSMPVFFFAILWAYGAVK